MKGLRRPVTSLLKSRGYVAQAATAEQSQQAPLTKQDVKVSRLSNGLTVVSHENYSPISRVGIFIKAGSRFESGNNRGITHALRTASDLSGQYTTGFKTTRVLQQHGANMMCTTSRDLIMYSMDCIRTGLEESIKYFVGSTCFPAFKPHEVETLSKRLRVDLGVLEQCPSTQLIEALHQAAFRGGLDNSLYMSDYAVGSHTPDMLASYVDTHYKADNMVVVGEGVDHDNLISYVKKAPIDGGAPTAKQSTYHGGEIRIQNNSPLVYAAVVTEGASLSSPDLIPVAVLQHAMGTGSHIKYSSSVSASKVAKAVAGATPSPFAATCINSSYIDSGLFGFQVVAQAEDMTNVLQSLVKTFADATKAGLTDADIQRAKCQLKSAILMYNESSGERLEDMGLQVMTSGQVVNVQQLVDAVDKVTLAQVQSAAKKVINAKPSMAAIGNLSDTPYIDQLL